MKKAIICITSIMIMLTLFLSSCSKKSNDKYKEDFIFTNEQYEPINLGKDDSYISSFDLIGIPKEGIKAAAWDSYDIKLRCFYDNDTVNDYSIKVINIPLDMRHYLGEIGSHSIRLIELNWIDSFDINIIENPDWDGFTCTYYDRFKNLLYKEKVGYYQNSNYNGKDIPLEEEDSNYIYRFEGWKYNTNYISQDMQFIATYSKLEKTNYAIKPYNKTYIPIVGMIDEEKKSGKGLIYLGRVTRVAAIHGDSKELDNDNITIDMNKKNFNYSGLWQEACQNIIEQVKYENITDYSLSVYGSDAGIVSLPNFAESFDSRYKYDWNQKAYLENNESVVLSRKEPYEDTLNKVYGFLFNTKTITREDNDPGFYRLAVVASFDVYVSISINKISSDQFEVGSYSEFIMSPVQDTFEFAIQYSKDNTFKNEFDNKLILSNEAIYNTCRMLDWND